MSEGKKIRIVLLHDKHLDILVQPKLFASELMEMTASHLMLRDKEYFGLSYKEDAGHYQWLTLDRRVLDHDLPKNQKPILLYFQVRLYVDSICRLKDPVTIELFYLNARQAIAQERLKCDSATVFDLAAYVLQEAHGDFTDDATTRSELKALPLIPVGTLKEHPSISFCEEQVIQRHKKLTGMSRGFAIVNYMKIVENLPSYGIHFYEVKDKPGLPWWLGLSVKGITIYDFNDRFTPRREFHWKRLLNLYYRDRKFSIQVHDSKSEGDDGGGGKVGATFGTVKSRRLLSPNQAGNVQSWFSSSSQLTKCIWSMAVCQHQRYIELRTTKSNHRSEALTVRSLVEVASDLTNSFLNHTPNTSDCSSLSATSRSSASNSKSELNEEAGESYKAAMQEMYNALKQRKEALEGQLMKKTKLLCQLCLQEAELTGFLPPETPVSSGDPIPKLRRRVGTSFALSPKVLERDYHNSTKVGLRNDLDDFDQLELDFEIQDKIAQAALMLAKDKSVRRSVRKKRALSYQRASHKLKEMEAKLLEHQLKSATRKDSFTAQSNISDGHLSEDGRDILESESDVNSAFNSPLISRHELDLDRLNQPASSCAAEDRVDEEEKEEEEPKAPNRSSAKVTQSSSEHSLLPPRGHVTETALSSPCSPVVETGCGQTTSNDVSPSPAPSPMVQRQRLGGYIASSIYSTRTQYRSQRYPTLCGTYAASQLLDDESKTSSSSSNSNLYSVWSSRSPYYDSGDELKTPSPATQRHPGFFATPTETAKSEGGSSGCLMKTSHSSSDVLDRTHTKPDSCVSSRGVASPATSEGKVTLQRCALLPTSDVTRGAFAVPPSDMRRGAGALPPGDVIRSTCHVVTSVNRSCYGNGSAHVVQNVRTETSRVYETTSVATLTGLSPASAETAPPPDHPNATCSETTVQKYHNYIEISKPFEMSDFYKYSERLRRQRLVGQVVSLSSSLAPEGPASVAKH